MRVFLAGATGAIGRPLLGLLVGAGHEVVATTRSASRAEGLREAGAEAAVVDALDADALGAAVREARPEVVVNQLTDLPARLNPRRPSYGLTPRLRREATATLAEAAAQAGARRLVSQSVAFLYRPGGDPVADEQAPVSGAPGTAFGDVLGATLELERITLGTPALEGIVLRYGWLYGPGTYYGEGGSTTEDVRRRRVPVIRGADGLFSFVHTEDAALAALAALDHGEPGIYNIADDEPAPMREWLPVFAEAIGARPPRRVPIWLARLVAGRAMTGQMATLRGASNSKAKRELGWVLSYPTWRSGFFEAPR